MNFGKITTLVVGYLLIKNKSSKGILSLVIDEIPIFAKISVNSGVISLYTEIQVDED
jgi:hypothetical protein